MATIAAEPKTPQALTLIGNKEFLAANLLAMGYAYINKDEKAGTISFEHIYDYKIITPYTLSIQELPLWDLFQDFTSAKNATATLLYILESGEAITPKLMKQQKSLTPKRELFTARNYAQFIAQLTPDEKTTLIKLATTWINAYYDGKTSFEAFYINGTTEQGKIWKNGDILLGYDPVHTQSVAFKVLQALPGGFITCTDDGGYFQIPATMHPRLIQKDEVEAEILEHIELTHEHLTAQIEEDKAATLKRVEKAEESAAKKEKEAAEKEAKAEAAKKLKAEQDKTKIAIFEELKAIPLDTPEAIKAAIDKLNLAKLAKEAQETIKARIKAAKAAAVLQKTIVVATKPAKKGKIDPADMPPAPTPAAKPAKSKAKAPKIALIAEEAEIILATPAPASKRGDKPGAFTNKALLQKNKAEKQQAAQNRK